MTTATTTTTINNRAYDARRIDCDRYRSDDLNILFCSFVKRRNEEEVKQREERRREEEK